jgi:hypothetical protein
MKGYFAGLARHTGIRIGPTRAGEISRASPSLAAEKAQQPAAGLAIEEVTFVSSPQPVAQSSNVAGLEAVERRSGDSAAFSESGDAARTDPVPGARHTESGVDSSVIGSPSMTTVESEVAEIASGSAAEILPSAAPEAVKTGPPQVIPEPQAAESSAASLVEVHDEVSASEPVREISTSTPGRSSDLDHEPSAAAIEEKIFDRLPAPPPDLNDDVSIERQQILRNYLKEVTEWISTPAIVEDEAHAPESSASFETDQNARSEFQRHISSQKDLRETPEQDGLSLSIGTIKIVIEEPQATPAAVAASPQAQSDKSAGRPGRARIDLSRYYINRW